MVMTLFGEGTLIDVKCPCNVVHVMIGGYKALGMYSAAGFRDLS